MKTSQEIREYVNKHTQSAVGRHIAVKLLKNDLKLRKRPIAERLGVCTLIMPTITNLKIRKLVRKGLIHAFVKHPVFHMAEYLHCVRFEELKPTPPYKKSMARKYHKLEMKLAKKNLLYKKCNAPITKIIPIVEVKHE